LFFLINIESISLIYAKRDITAFDSDVLLYELIFLAAECVAYISLAVFIDKMSNRPSAVRTWKSFIRMMTCRCCCSKVRTSPEASTAADGSTNDEDVAIENERVASGAADDSLIVVNDLTKIYDNGKRAVDHLSLGVPAGECFGLLGINGAGKCCGGNVWPDQVFIALVTTFLPPSIYPHWSYSISRSSFRKNNDNVGPHR